MAENAANSIDVIFQLAKGRIDEQNTRIGTLDTKANFSVASSTILITAASSLRESLGKAQTDKRLSPLPINLPLVGTDTIVLVDYLTVGAFATFLILAYFAIRAYQLRDYTIVPNLDVLLDQLTEAPAETTKLVVAHAWADALYENEARIDKKVRWTKSVIVMLGFQAIWLVAMAVIQARLTV